MLHSPRKLEKRSLVGLHTWPALLCVVGVRCKPQEVFLGVGGNILLHEDVADVCLGPNVFRP